MFKEYIYTLRYLQEMLISRVYQNIGWSNIEVQYRKRKQSYDPLAQAALNPYVGNISLKKIIYFVQ